MYTENDVLDLSGKSENQEKTVHKKVDDDVILLSEDEDEAMIDALCNEMEKENAPNSKLRSKTKALLAKMENELRNEESTLLLLQQLRANQRAHSTQPKSKTTAAHSTPKPTNNAHSNSMHYHVTASDRVVNSPSPARMPQSIPPARPTQAQPQTLQQQPAVTGHQIQKVTKVMALQALEQQWNGKKAVLQKHLEKSLDKVPLPRPSSGTGPSDVAFVPSTLTNEFTALIGLEEIVHTIQDYDPSCGGKSEETHCPCTPFVCANCGTDFTPVWKRKRSGSSDVVCEACIIDELRSGIHRSYSNMVSSALKQNATSERELEHEYQEIVNSPTKLDAFIKEQERKLLAAQPPPVVQPPQPPQPSSSVNPVQNQRYHQQQSFQAQNAYANVGIRHPQAAAVNSAVSAATAAAAHLSIPVANARRQAASSATLVTSASAPSLSIAQQQQQNQVAATNNVVQQFASQYQQLTKAAAAAAQAGHVAGGNANVTANLMMAAAAASPMLVAAAAANATSQQQQQQQQAAAAAAVQQRLVAAAALSGFQHQQQQQQQQQSSLDQYARIQELLMNTILCNAATAGTQNAAIRQPQHAVQQALLQYACLLQQQQQQQQAATQAQQQQQANAAALQQFMSNSVSNSAACMALLQSWWALNAAAGAGTKK